MIGTRCIRSGGTSACAVAARAAGRAFSLVEILFAIIILSLGLLGVAAIFPVVITQQQQAQDSVQAAVAMTAAEAALSRGSGVSELLLIQDGVDSDGSGDDFDNDASLGNIDEDNPFFPHFWETDWIWADFTGVNPAFGDGPFPPGTILYGPALNEDGVLLANLPYQARLVPAAYSGQAPVYVWDFVPRRAPNGSIEAAIFVRRIDSGIVVPRDSTLDDVLYDRDETDIVPLAFDYERRRVVPRGDLSRGSADTGYSTILGLQARLIDDFDTDNDDPGRTVLLSVNDPGGSPSENRPSDLEDEIGILTRPGQRIVDNLGIVRRVIGPGLDAMGEEVPGQIRVDPPYTRAALRSADGGDADFTNQLLQIIYTPEPPVAVKVTEIGR